jgi:hypothetical protein
MAELEPDLKNQISHRAVAARAAKKLLSQMLTELATAAAGSGQMGDVR